MSKLKISNNAVSRLSANISAADTSISLLPGGGAKFPVLAADEWFPATFVKVDGTLEIVRVIARATDVLTVVRGQEATAALAFNAGDRVEHRFTAKAYTEENARVEAIAQEALDTVSSSVTDLQLALAAPTGAEMVGFGAQTIAQYFKTGLARVVNSIAEMLALDEAVHQNVFVTGYYAPGDGGGGVYRVNMSDTTSAVNPGTNFASLHGYRWQLAQGGIIGYRTFGAKGDGIASDTASINAFYAYLVNGAATRQHMGIKQTGTYKIDGAGVKVTIDDTCPNMLSDGGDSVIFKGTVSPLMTLEVSGGSGMHTVTEWLGVKLDGVTNSGSNVGLLVNGACFINMKGWKFYNLDTPVLFGNFKAGVFCEGVVFDNCYWHTSNGRAVRFSRTGGTDSFRSCGFTNTCQIDAGASYSEVILVDSGCVPYFMSLHLTLWNYKSDLILVRNNSTQIACHGVITCETQGSSSNKLTMASGGPVLFAGPIKAWNFDEGKFVMGTMVQIDSFLNVVGSGQLYTSKPTSRKFPTTVTGGDISIPYNAGVSRPYLQDSAEITISVSATGYLWIGVGILRSGATANIVNGTLLVNDLILNTGGYGAMTINQGSSYNILFKNPTLPAGAVVTWSIAYKHGLIPQS